MAAQEEKRPPSRTVLMLVVVTLLGLGLGGSLLTVDFGGAFFLDRLRAEVQQTLGCTVDVEDISGNPLGGFALRGFSLSRKDGPLLWAESVRVQLDPYSLLQGAPAPGFLELCGLTLDGPRSMPLLRSLDAAPSTAPLPSLRLLEISISLDHHKLTVDRLNLERRGEVFNLEASLALNTLPLELRGTFDLQGERVVLDDGTFRIGEGEGTLRGSLGTSLDLAGAWNGVRMEDLASVTSSVTSEDRGTSAGRFRAWGLLENPSLSGDLSVDQGVFRGVSLDHGFAAWRFASSRLRVEEARGILNGAPWRGTLSVDFSRPSLWVEGRGVGQELDEAPWRTTLSLPPSLRGHAAQVDLFFQLRGEALEGRAFFQGLSAEFETWALSEGRVLTSFSSEKLSFQGSGRWLGAPLRASGDVITLGDTPRLNASVTLSQLPLERLKELFPDLRQEGLEGKAQLRATLRGSLRAPEILGNVDVGTLGLRGHRLEKLRSTFVFRDQRLELSRAEGLWGESRLSASGTVDQCFGAGRYALQGSVAPLSAKALGALLPDLAPFAPGGGRNTVQWRLEGSFAQPRGEVTLRNPKAVVKKIPLGALVVEGSWSGSRFTLRQLQAGSGGRVLRMTGAVTLGKDPGLDFRGSFQGVSLRALGLAPWRELSADARLSGSFSLRGPASRPVGEGAFTADQIRGLPVALKGARGELVFAQNRLTVRRFLASGGDGGNLSLSGSVALGASPVYALEGMVQDIPLQNTQSFLGDGAGLFLRGELSGSLSVDNRGQKPSLRFRGSVPLLTANGFSFADVTGTLGTNGEKITLEELEGTVGSGLITASADAERPDGDQDWTLAFSVRGEHLDVASLLKNMGKGTVSGARGQMDLKLRGRLQGSSLTGQGTVSAPSLSLGGVTVRDLSAPLRLTDKGLTVEKARARAYGGTLDLSGQLERHGRWKATGWLRSADLSPLLKDLASLSGDVSGTGSIKAALSGRLGDLYATEADISLEASNGKISGFSAAEAMASATDGGHTVAFASIRSTMTVNGRVLYILPGSRMAAPPGDPSYRYLMVDGSLPLTGKPMNLSCLGEINARTLNAFLGALRGLMDAAQNTENLVQDVLLGGLVGSMTRRDFRQVSFKIQGTLENPVLADLSVSGKNKVNLSPPTIPGETADSTSNTGEKSSQTSDKFSLTLSFPTGKGAPQSDDMGGQLQEQILEQLLKRVIPGVSPAPAQP